LVINKLREATIVCGELAGGEESLSDEKPNLKRISMTSKN